MEEAGEPEDEPVYTEPVYTEPVNEHVPEPVRERSPSAPRSRSASSRKTSTPVPEPVEEAGEPEDEPVAPSAAPGEENFSVSFLIQPFDLSLAFKNLSLKNTRAVFSEFCEEKTGSNKEVGIFRGFYGLF
jgi:hypothetical protein